MKSRREILALVPGFASPVISGCNFFESKTTILISNATADELQVTVSIKSEENSEIVFDYNSAIAPNSDQEREIALTGRRNTFTVEASTDHHSDSARRSEINSSVLEIGVGITDEEISIGLGVK